jgi:hypothetical protein
MQDQVINQSEIRPEYLGLIEQAGFSFWQDEPWGPGENRVDWSMNYDEEIQELIRLVVNECIDMLDVNTAWSAIRLRKRFGLPLK